MLYFLTRGRHQYTIRVFRQHMQADYLEVVPHEIWDETSFGPGDIAIFCDIDRCNEEEVAALKTTYDQVAATGCRVLNDPGKVMRRYELLKGLYADGANSFRVFRPEELPGATDISFPVFMRDELEHDGPGSALIHSYSDLQKVLAGDIPPNPLLCEFIDTTREGHHHKYGAFVLEGKVIPRHFFLSESWNVKSASGDREYSQQLEIDYVRQNPHEEEMRQIAAYANIDFGRIDYAITNAGIQVFEINTNPTIIDRGDIKEGNPREWITQQFIETIGHEFKNLKPNTDND